MGIGSYGLPSQSHTLGNSISDGEANSLRQNVLNPDQHDQTAIALKAHSHQARLRPSTSVARRT